MSTISMWGGAPTPSGITLVGHVTGTPTNVRVAYSTSSGLSSPSYSSGGAPSAQGVVKRAITGLTANTTYYYALEIDGAIDTATTGKFKTLPPVGTAASFKFAFGNCAGGTTAHEATGWVTNHPVFDTIRTHDPAFFLHLGDIHYKNIATDAVDDYRLGYTDVMAQSRQHALYRNVASDYIWDDHDFGPNDGDRNIRGRAAAAQAYRERVPHYPLPDAGNIGVWHSFQVGRVLFVAWDCRSQRDPKGKADTPAKTMLGAAQKAWFFNLLETSNAAAMCILSSLPWLGAPLPGSDSWFSYTWEREEIARKISDTGWANRTFMLGGDGHMIRADNGSNNTYGDAKFPVMHAAPLDSTPGVKEGSGPFSEPGPANAVGSYGIINVTDNGTTINVAFSARREA